MVTRISIWYEITLLVAGSHSQYLSNYETGDMVFYSTDDKITFCDLIAITFPEVIGSHSAEDAPSSGHNVNAEGYSDSAGHLD